MNSASYSGEFGCGKSCYGTEQKKRNSETWETAVRVVPKRTAASLKIVSRGLIRPSTLCPVILIISRKQVKS